ncbi:MAG TPA: GcrA family cell cycle regulator [Caulobacteraceae bacterium]|jgi:GcrA cell cycle regulator|nr:GcrA family cell cycle regulator [Caulobacteraceae bacterium]
MGWTDERVETLKTLWLDGLSASQIAKQLGGVTRNAVIGKVHRLGLSGRATPSQPSAALRPARAPRPITPAAPRRTVNLEHRPMPMVSMPERIEERGGATVLTLGAHMCKWPIGDPSSSEFSFCGRRAQEERPYCIEHAKLAYQPVVAGKRKPTASELTRSLRRYI